MRARLWGTRGSVASPGPDTVRYGGNTSCVEVRTSDDELIVLDAGTGMRSLGLTLLNSGITRIHVLLTHLHMDHLQGLGFFKPLYDPNVELIIYGPPSPTVPLADRIATYLSPPLFPVALSDVPCRLSFHDADGSFEIGAATVTAASVVHQGSTVGYRIDDHGRSLTYIPDHEPSLGVLDLALQDPSWVSGSGLAQNVDVLLHDAQYSSDEYPNHVGWGHSAIEHVVAFAQLSGVQKLVFFHHDPLHTDSDLDELRACALATWPGNPDDLVLGFEGMELDLSAAGQTATHASG